MKFEHLIEINDPANPLLMPLVREQVWAGLMWRVLDPQAFLPGLQGCRILERDERRLLRELDFGPARLRDHVQLSPPEWVSFTIEPSTQHAGGCLTIRIEEPTRGALFLRFCYETNFAEAQSEDRAYIEYVKSAYHHSDIDCVRLIRQHAAQSPGARTS